MGNVIYKEVALQEHEDTTGERVCYVCHGVMKPCIYTSTFNLPHKGSKVRVSGIKAHKCEACGEVVYSSLEAKLIESAIHKALSKED